MHACMRNDVSEHDSRKISLKLDHVPVSIRLISLSCFLRLAFA